MNGRKDDAEKPDYSLLPWRGLDEVVRVLTFGARKYSRDNWKSVPDGRNRYFAAALRHMSAWGRGEERDGESSLHHLAHATVSLLYIIEGGLDDRNTDGRGLGVISGERNESPSDRKGGVSRMSGLGERVDRSSDGRGPASTTRRSPASRATPNPVGENNPRPWTFDPVQEGAWSLAHDAQGSSSQFYLDGRDSPEGVAGEWDGETPESTHRARTCGGNVKLIITWAGGEENLDINPLPRISTRFIAEGEVSRLVQSGRIPPGVVVKGRADGEEWTWRVAMKPTLELI